MLLSASENSSSSIPSAVYQCKNAFRRNIDENWSMTRRNSSWIHVELPINVADMGRLRGGISQTTLNNPTGCLGAVGNPFHKVGIVMLLVLEHVLFHFLGRDLASEQSGHGQIASVARIRGSHHVAVIKHLRGQLGNSQVAIGLGIARCQGCKANHEEMQTWKGHHVDSQLSQVCIQLTRETQASRDAAHDSRYQVVEIAIVGVVDFERAKTDIIQGLVIDTECGIRVLNQLMGSQDGIVWLHDSVRDFWRR